MPPRPPPPPNQHLPDTGACDGRIGCDKVSLESVVPHAYRQRAAPKTDNSNCLLLNDCVNR